MAQEDQSGSGTLDDILDLLDGPAEWLGEGWTSVGGTTASPSDDGEVGSASLAGPMGQQLTVRVFGKDGRVGEMLVTANLAFEASVGAEGAESPVPEGLTEAFPECRDGRYAEGSTEDAGAVSFRALALCYTGRTGAVLIDFRGLFTDAGAGSTAFLALLAPAAPEARPLESGWKLPEGAKTSGRFLGQVEAPVTLQVWDDYQSVGSRHFLELVLPELYEEFVGPGLVRLQPRPYPFLGEESLLAAAAAECAALQDRFWDLHLVLHQNSPEKPDTGAFSRERLALMASSSGLRMTEFEDCMDRESTGRALDRYTADAKALGVNSIPSMVIDGKRVQWKGWADLRSDIESAIAASRSARDAEPTSRFTATIQDGTLADPDVTVPAGADVTMTIENDRFERTLGIEGILPKRVVGPGRVTNIRFLAPERPGRHAIQVDGVTVGALFVAEPSSARQPPTFELDAADVFFAPADLTIPANEDVRLIVVNTGRIPHSFTIGPSNDGRAPDPGVSIDIAPGEREEMTVNVPPGQYPFWCLVPGHKQAGMVGSLDAR